MKRRTFLKSSIASLAMAGTIRFPFSDQFRLTRTVQAQENTSSLPIPPLLENLDKSGKTATFSMSAQQGSVELFPGKPTPTFGYNGSFLGPTIRVRNGQKFKMNFKNNLPETTTLHWHGMHLPAKWDGGPRQPVQAGSSWNPEFTIKQEAATLWYHPHAMGLTGEQVYKGLAGLVLVEDDVSDRLKIPKTYGVDDIPLVIQDRRFFSNGKFAYVQSMHDVINGVIGNYMLVNGALQPGLNVHKNLIRFRLLNGSNSSIYRIQFGNSIPFTMIASDGGFLEKPVNMDSILLSAGERAEVLVDFSRFSLGSHIGLKVQQINGNQFDAMSFTVNRESRDQYTLPKVLRKMDRIPESSADRVRPFVMETTGGMGMMMGNRLTINGKQMDLNRVDETVRLGSTEIWEITNRSSMMMTMPHSMHLHDVQFQILSRNGKIPPAHEKGRKDTVLILPGETVRIIARFQDYKGIYMHHCHLLEHEDDGMMGQFEVV